MIAQSTNPNLIAVEIQRQIAPNQYLHIQYGTLCHGIVLKPGVLFIKNCQLNTEVEVDCLIREIKKSGVVRGIENFFSDNAILETCGEFVVGSPCKVSLWHSLNLAKIERLAASALKINLANLFSALNSNSIPINQESYPERLPIARFPGKAHQDKKIGIVCVASNEIPGIIRYSSETTHNVAYHTIHGELLVSKAESPRQPHFTHAHSAHCVFTLQELNMLYVDQNYPQVPFFSDVINRAVAIYDPDLLVKDYILDNH